MTSGSLALSGLLLGTPGRRTTVNPAAYSTSATARSMAAVTLRSSLASGCCGWASSISKAWLSKTVLGSTHPT